MVVVDLRNLRFIQVSFIFYSLIIVYLLVISSISKLSIAGYLRGIRIINSIAGLLNFEN